MRRREAAIDVGISALTFAVSLMLLAVRGFGTPSPHTRGLDAVGVMLAFGSALPLVARRYAPLTVYVLTSAASMALILLWYSFDVPVAQLFAVYALAEAYGSDPSRWRRWAVMFAAAVFIPATAAAYATRGDGVRDALPAMVGWALVFVGVWIAGTPGRWWRWLVVSAAALFIPGTVASFAVRDRDVQVIVPAMASWGLVFVGVWIAGDRARFRRVQLAELEERAARTEREAEREARLAAAEERTRIARELHDSAGHAINVILVQAGAARLLHGRDPDRSRQAITTIEEVARSTITEIDRLVLALRDDHGVEPPAPAEPAAFDELLEGHRASGLTIAADIRGSREPLPRSIAWAAYRILQEALTNAARHGPGSADVTLAFDPDAVEITVTNPTDARATPPATGGHGIIGMRERAIVLGGILQAGADDDTFRLHARLPRCQETP
ncbi:histidine kinase [Actinoallomurus sp. NPDC050550]|uniref:sensor histidine kinase n=1 Tax=Actinoallomurus sp. NPDC050550 TaxID=3154937 RepID=UPI0033D0C825